MGQQESPDLQEWPRHQVKVLLETAPPRATSISAHTVPQVHAPRRQTCAGLQGDPAGPF